MATTLWRQHLSPKEGPRRVRLRSINMPPETKVLFLAPKRIPTANVPNGLSINKASLKTQRAGQIDLPCSLDCLALLAKKRLECALWDL